MWSSANTYDMMLRDRPGIRVFAEGTGQMGCAIVSAIRDFQKPFSPGFMAEEEGTQREVNKQKKDSLCISLLCSLCVYK